MMGVDASMARLSAAAAWRSAMPGSHAGRSALDMGSTEKTEPAPKKPSTARSMSGVEKFLRETLAKQTHLSAGEAGMMTWSWWEMLKLEANKRSCPFDAGRGF